MQAVHDIFPHESELLNELLDNVSRMVEVALLHFQPKFYALYAFDRSKDQFNLHRSAGKKFQKAFPSDIPGDQAVLDIKPDNAFRAKLLLPKTFMASGAQALGLATEHYIATHIALQKRRFELLLLQELTSDLSQTSSLRTTASLLTSKIKVLLGVRSAYFFHSYDRRRFVCLGHWKEGEKMFFDLDDTKRIASLETSALNNFLTKEFKKQNPQAQSLKLWQKFIQKDESGSARMTALIGLGDKWQGSLGADDVLLLQMIAQQAGPLIANAERYEHTVELTNTFQDQLNSERGWQEMVGQSPAMKKVYKIIDKFTKSEKNSTILIRGETGTGKELIAGAIHTRSRRRDKPMIAVNCGAIPHSLIESELFGHEKGAFTDAKAAKKGKFELANHGTIFLDEIGDLPLEAQAKLLRVLQNRTVEKLGGTISIPLDIQVIAATHVNLESLIERKMFREDLYYRLNIFPLELPPLRERMEDLPLLIVHFIQKHSRALKIVPGQAVTPAALEWMKRYPWPGNIRELENIIERALIVGALPIDVHQLPKDLPSSASPDSLLPSGDLASQVRQLQSAIAELEQRFGGSSARRVAASNIEDDFLAVMRKHHFRTESAARELAISGFRLRDIFKGICFKFYAENLFDVAKAAEMIAGKTFLTNKVRSKMGQYLSNLSGQLRNNGRDFLGSVSFTNYLNKIPLEYREFTRAVAGHLESLK